MKTSRKMLFLTLAACAVSLGATQATAATDTTKTTYKLGTFNDIDVDRSGFLENGEYQSYAFGMADWDKDGYLEKTEWAAYTRNFYDRWGLDYDSVTYYDTDGDGRIDVTEFNELPVNTDLYSAWDFDKDQMISSKDWDRVVAFYEDNDNSP